MRVTDEVVRELQMSVANGISDHTVQLLTACPSCGETGGLYASQTNPAGHITDGVKLRTFDVEVTCLDCNKTESTGQTFQVRGG